MHYDHSDSLLSAAFGVIKHYDPKTYARMADDDSWIVDTMSGNYGYGETLSSANRQLHGESMTRINPDAITDTSERYKLDSSLFAAAVLVHEYRHAHQPLKTVENTELAESQAFRAGSAFAAKLPGYDGQAIKLISDATLKDMASNPAYIAQDVMNNR